MAICCEERKSTRGRDSWYCTVVYSSSIYSAFVILDIFLLEHKGVVMGEVGKAVNLPLPL